MGIQVKLASSQCLYQGLIRDAELLRMTSSQGFIRDLMLCGCGSWLNSLCALAAYVFGVGPEVRRAGSQEE